MGIGLSGYTCTAGPLNGKYLYLGFTYSTNYYTASSNNYITSDYLPCEGYRIPYITVSKTLSTGTVYFQARVEALSSYPLNPIEGTRSYIKVYNFPTPTPTISPTPTSTSTPVPPTATPSPTPTSTSTPVPPTSTPTPTPTATSQIIFTIQPSNVTLLEGGTDVFVASAYAAVSGAGPIVYRWQRSTQKNGSDFAFLSANSMPVIGGISSYYIEVSAIPIYNEFNFRVAVSATGTSTQFGLPVYSNTARLSVINWPTPVPPTATPSPTPTPTPTRTPTPTPTATLNLPLTGVLFDKTSFAPTVSNPYLSCLMLAVDRWNKYIQIDPVVVQSIRDNIDYSFNGIKLNSYSISNLGTGSYIAACSIQTYIDLVTSSPSVKFCSYRTRLGQCYDT
ncbi:hypothetical protein EBU95_14795 [bacterium]|nr:hypothetical protein [bacterium]